MTVRLNQSAVNALATSPQVQEDMQARAERVLAMQKRLVPVDTGDLSNDLHIEDLPNGGKRIGSTNIDYAAAVEEGHETTAGTWVPAQPYIRPSIDAARG